MPLFAWAALALVAGYVLKAFIAPSAKPPASAALADFEFPQYEEGTPEAVVFGDVWTDGWQVLWYGNLRTVKIKAKGGKK